MRQIYKLWTINLLGFSLSVIAIVYEIDLRNCNLIDRGQYEARWSDWKANYLKKEEPAKLTEQRFF